jgi:hypothetical protein
MSRDASAERHIRNGAAHAGRVLRSGCVKCRRATITPFQAAGTSGERSLPTRPVGARPLNGARPASRESAWQDPFSRVGPMLFPRSTEQALWRIRISGHISAKTVTTCGHDTDRYPETSTQNADIASGTASLSFPGQTVITGLTRGLVSAYSEVIIGVSAYNVKAPFSAVSKAGPGRPGPCPPVAGFRFPLLTTADKRQRTGLSQHDSLRIED